MQHANACHRLGEGKPHSSIFTMVYDSICIRIGVLACNSKTMLKIYSRVKKVAVSDDQYSKGDDDFFIYALPVSSCGFSMSCCARIAIEIFYLPMAGQYPYSYANTTMHYGEYQWMWLPFSQTMASVWHVACETACDSRCTFLNSEVCCQQCPTVVNAPMTHPPILKLRITIAMLAVFMGDRR